jgi:hypothetical protein
MLTITLNGQVEKINIGCRTFISLNSLLDTLESENKCATLNGVKVAHHNFSNTDVKGGDVLVLE